MTLEVSAGPGNVARARRWTGCREAQAIKELEKAGPQGELARSPRTTVREGYAIRTVPERGRPVVTQGSRVTLFVSSGPRAGRRCRTWSACPRESAETACDDEGLKVVVREAGVRQADGRGDRAGPGGGSESTRARGSRSRSPRARRRSTVPDVVGLPAATPPRSCRQRRPEVRSSASRPVTTEDEDGLVVDQRPRRRQRGRQGHAPW